MSRYSTRGSMALTAAKSIHSLIGSATVRPKLYDLILSSGSAPNDYSTQLFLQRFTADGTGTAVTPQPLDPADPVAIATSKTTYTVEPTLTANQILLQLSHNLRASVRWVAAPGSEIVVPATAGNGIALLCNAVSTQFTEDVTMMFEE